MPRPRQIRRKDMTEPEMEPAVGILDPPKMHRIFGTVELVDLICEDLERPELLALAMTCRRFQSSALRRLYHSLSETDVLCLLSDYASNLWHDSHTLHGGMDEASFSAHSKLVHNLELELSGTDAYDIAHKLSVINARNTSLPIFPSLRMISASFTSPDHLVILLSILTGGLPSLNTLAVLCETCYTSEPEEIAVLLDILPIRCPQLRTLNLTLLGCARPAISTLLSITAKKLKHLDRLCVIGVRLDIELIQSLSRHPNMTTLSLQDTQMPASNSISVTPCPADGIPRLRDLHLALQVTDAARMLRAFPETLEELRLEASTDGGRGSDIQALAEVLPRFPRLTRLELDLSKTEQGKRARTVGGIISLSSILSHVSACQKLQAVRIYGDSDVDAPEDEDLELVAESWRDLRSLELRWRGTIQGPTLVSLLALSDRCRHLSKIELSSLQAEDSGILPGGDMHTEGLSLVITSLQAHKLDALAALLAGRWPSVQLHAGPHTRAILDCIRTVRRYQAGQTTGLPEFHLDNDTVLYDFGHEPV